MTPDPTAPPPDGLPEFVLDGASFNDLDGFFTAVTTTLGTFPWGSNNLDAFNDILRGGFGTPEDGFVLRWTSAELSAQRLGWPETIRYVEKKLTTCHPDNVPHVEADLRAAQRQEGQTLFEIITDIIASHGPGGREADDNVHLVLT
jgi:Barstar (barnase inhibitor)